MPAGAVVVDVTPPAVTLTSPGNGSTITAAPGLLGRGGQDWDSPVTVQTFAGAAAAGIPVQSLTATPLGGAWSVAGGALAPGTYTAIASQTDAAGNVGSARRSRSRSRSRLRRSTRGRRRP